MKTTNNHQEKQNQQAVILALGCVLLLLCAILTACNDNDDQPTVNEIIEKCVNPPVYLLLEDSDGNNLLTDTTSVKVVSKRTGMPVEHRVERISGTDFLVVTPETPYHDPEDKEYIYTLNTSARVTVDGMSLDLNRAFDYKLSHRDTSKGRTADISYSPVVTMMGNAIIEGDTAHIIFEDSYPYLYIERDTISLEARFPAISDELAKSDSLVRLEMSYSGRTIALPKSETLSYGNRTDADSTYFAVQVSIVQPYIYDSNGRTDNTFAYNYSILSSTLFGDSYTRDISLEFYINELSDTNLTLLDCSIGLFKQNIRFATVDPYSIVINWYDYP